MRNDVGFMGVQDTAGGGAFLCKQYFIVDGTPRRALVPHGIMRAGGPDDGGRRPAARTIRSAGGARGPMRD
jgi:hypothetical protein